MKTPLVRTPALQPWITGRVRNDSSFPGRRDAASVSRTRIALAVAAAFMGSAQVLAQPVGGQAIQGAASFTQQGSSLVVNTQNAAGTNRSVLSWQSFSVPAGSTTQFNQPSSTSLSINRVLGNDPSAIFGTLSSNGRLVLVNPAGIAVGAGAVVDTAGFTASTLRMSEADALAGRLVFGGDGLGGGPLSIQGQIVARSGDVVLIAPNVQVGSQAVIQSPNGATVLAAGQKVEITGRGLEGIRMELQAPTDQAVNLGTLQGDAVGIFAGQLKHSGLIQATAITTEGGKVILKATGGDALVDGSIQAKALAGQGGTQGGNIDVLGQRVGLLAGAKLDASGEAGGGNIRVGGDFHGANADVPNAQRTYVDANATINADATVNGNGGRIVVWADDQTQSYGAISARGGNQGGDGGFVEVSGKHKLDFTSAVDTRAPMGQTGTLLLDPDNITIAAYPLASSYGGQVLFADAPSALTLNVATINASASNIVLEATNQIDINAPIDISTPGIGFKATAGNALNLNSSITTKDGAVELTSAPLIWAPMKIKGSIDTTHGGVFAGNAITLNSSLNGAILINSVVLDAGISSVTIGGPTVIQLNNVAVAGDSIKIDTAQYSQLNISASTLTAGAGGISLSADAVTLDGSSLATSGASIKILAFSLANGYGGANLYNASVTAGTGDITINGSYAGGRGVSGVNLSNAVLSAEAGVFVNGSTTGGGTRAAVEIYNLTGAGPLTVSGRGVSNVGVAIGGAIDRTGAISISGATGYGDAVRVDTATLKTGGGDLVVSGVTKTIRSGTGLRLVGASIDTRGGNLRLSGSSSVDGSLRSDGTPFHSGIRMEDTSIDTGGGRVGINSTATVDLYRASIRSGGGDIAIQSFSKLSIDPYSWVSTVAGGSGEILLQADSIDIQPGTLIDSGTARTRFTPNSAARAISVGGADDPTKLNISQAELDTVTASEIVIGGSAFPGGLAVDGAIAVGDRPAATPIPAPALALLTGGNLTLNSTISSNALGTAVTLAGANFINNVGANALVLTGAGARWMIYSGDPATDTFAGLVSGNEAIWNTAYPVAGGAAGNRYVFVLQPTVTVTAAGQSKTYDATAVTPAPLTYVASPLVDAAAYAGVFSQDALTGALEIALPSKNVGTYAIAQGTLLQPTGYALSYTGSQFVITPATLTVSGLSATNKVYDTLLTDALSGTATVTGFAGDTLGATGGAGTFGDKNVGTAKSVTVSGVSLTGADAGNYLITQPTGLTANITPLTLTVSGLSATNKVYDASTGANIAGLAALNGVLAGDSLDTAGGTAAFMDANVRTGKTVSVTGMVLNGTDAGNYLLMQPVMHADISPANLTITAKNQSKAEGVTFSFLGNEFTAAGLVGIETINRATLASAATPVSARPGSYAITPSAAVGASGFRVSNYNISYEPGSMRVTAGPAADVINPLVSFLTLFTQEINRTDDKYKNSDGLAAEVECWRWSLESQEVRERLRRACAE